MTPDDPRHGTRAGYDVHYRQGETACDPCRRANADRMVARRRRLANPLTAVEEVTVQRWLYALEADDILDETRGRWVRRPRSGGVLEWVPKPPTSADRRDEELYGPVVCPTCSARQTQPCKSPAGVNGKSHVDRTVPRSCLCGALISNKSNRCRECRNVSSRALRASKETAA